ncbi:MAG: TetR/AcrR family transcriptional regulator [Actinomycetota bacterium]|nr:TetR/AcrR family transcriptional regulator [Actinomycetota bacterium]
MQAATEAFGRRGYLGVNLKDVVERIGLTKGALYYFFPTKQDLAVEIVNRYVGRWGPIVAEVGTTCDDALDAVVEMSYRAARAVQTDPIARAGTRLLIEGSLVPADLPRPFEDWTLEISRLLQLGQSRGQLRVEANPAVVAEILVAFLYGAHSISNGPDEMSDLSARLDQFWDLLLRSLRPI